MQTLVNIILSYLIGSISGSMVLGKIKGIDIREMGSGNAGGTNAFRSIGPLFALGVIIIDILKGIIAVYYVSNFEFVSLINLSNEFMHVLCGIAAILGHVYPIYYKFKGGKGAGTMIGIVGILYPECILYALLSWILILILSGYVGLSTMIAGIVLSIQASLISDIPTSYLYFSYILDTI